MLAVAAVLACTPAVTPDPVEEAIGRMDLRHKVGMMFHVRPQDLQDTLYPVGGVVLFAQDITDSVQLKALTDSLHNLPWHPLVCIDEEGGRVARIGSNPAFDVPRYKSMTAVGRGGVSGARGCGGEIGRYLKRFGVDVNFAPVADVNTNPENPVIGRRAFSCEPVQAGQLASAYLEGLEESGVTGCLKHFPGHGDTTEDTHEGFAHSDKTWEEMLSCEILPFKAGIDAGASMVMVSHISTPRVTGNVIPASLSRQITTEKLREELGFQGIIITDGMAMGAIANKYGSGEATLMAIDAGADIILLPENLPEAFDAVLDAVQKDSTITLERIDSSVRRILKRFENINSYGSQIQE